MCVCVQGPLNPRGFDGHQQGPVPYFTTLRFPKSTATPDHGVGGYRQLAGPPGSADWAGAGAGAGASVNHGKRKSRIVSNILRDLF